MEAKEKAKELVFKYENLVTIWDCYNDEPMEIKFRLGDMKKCALISLNDKIISINKFKHPSNSRAMNRRVDKELKHLEEVKEEINKL
jgi:hypothetical protein